MKLNGKKLLFLGDSITEGTGVETPENIYLNRLARMTGARAALNFGIGGTTLGRNRSPGWRTGAFVVRAQTLPEEAWDADVAFVFGGVNDYGVGDAAFGPADSCDPFEINGALNIIVRSLRGMNPRMEIVFLSPICRPGDDAPHPVTGQPLQAYAELVRQAALRSGCSFCDLFHLFAPGDEQTCRAWIPDGLHPNDEGHRILAETILRFLNTLA